MTPNFLVICSTAIIPFLVAFVWFHPKVFGGDTWAKVAGLTKEQMDQPISPLKLGLSILLNLFAAFGLYNLAVHQSAVFGMLGGDIELLKTGTGAAFIAEHGSNNLNFGHGFFHGILTAVVLVFPVLGYATIFERKSGKYLLINLGFWMISLALMGGILSLWGGVPVQ